jgi:hypothetical protein
LSPLAFCAGRFYLDGVICALRGDRAVRAPVLQASLSAMPQLLRRPGTHAPPNCG